MWAGLFRSVKRRVPFHIEVKLFLVQVIVSIEDHRCHLEAEQKLVLFEDSHTSVIVHGLSHLFAQVPWTRVALNGLEPCEGLLQFNII